MESKIIGLRSVALNRLDPLRFGNPRTMPAAMRQTLRNALVEFGYVKPIIAREVGTGKKSRFEIIDGHHRYADIKEQGAVEVEILVVDIPDDGVARKIAMSLNRIGADWDNEKLAAYVDALITDTGTSIESILATSGFGADELEILSKIGTGFLDDIIAPVVSNSPDEIEDAAEIEKVRPGTIESGDRVKLSLVCSPSEHAAIYAAIKRAKQLEPELTTVQALAKICKFYSEKTP